jgi:DNA modification methylase
VLFRSWFGPTNETTVWDVARAARNDLHPTQKPLALFSRAIRNSSAPGDLILDPFMGSGTTLRAAKDLGRRGIGIEIEEKYCEIAAKRMGQETLFGIGG